MKRKFLVLLSSSLLLLTGCGNNTPASTSANQSIVSNPSSSVVKYLINYVNTSMVSTEVSPGTQINEPSEPKKSNSVFGGWYLDANFTQKASFPIIVNSDINLYAKFYSYEEAFQKARKETIDDSNTFEMNYSLNASATVSGVTFSGNTSGLSKYDKNATTSFYDEHTNSGKLFVDGKGYQIKNGNNLSKLLTDNDGNLRYRKVEEVDASYKFDSSSFAKALFEWDDSALKSITPTSNENEYLLKTSFTASKALSILGNNLNNPIVESIIGDMPETSVDTGIYVKFANGLISKYRYKMTINVSALTLNLQYEANFTNVNKPITINPKSFSGIAVTEADIASTKSVINKVLNDYKASSHSSYDVDVKTGVDFGATKAEINSTFDASTKRTKIGGELYFHNDIELDSDFKNSSMYKDDISDIHMIYSKLSDKSLWSIEKKVLSDTRTDITSSYQITDNDRYYLLDVFGGLSNYSFIQTTKKGGTQITNYSVGLDSSNVYELLTYLNSNLNLNLANKEISSGKKPVVFGSLSRENLEVKSGEFVISVDNGNLSSIKIDLSCRGYTKFEGSADYASLSKCSMSLNFELVTNTNGQSYTPYDTAKDAGK